MFVDIEQIELIKKKLKYSSLNASARASPVIHQVVRGLTPALQPQIFHYASNKDGLLDVPFRLVVVINLVGKAAGTI